MTRVRPLLVVLVSMLGSLAVLASEDDMRRVWGFRAYVVVVGVLALRALFRWLDGLPKTMRPEAFRSPRRVWWPRRAPESSPRGSDRVLHLAGYSAGDAHRGLRPLLREIADERLRARHGIPIDDPRAAQHLLPATWELVRADRPTPHDRRAPGLDPDAIDVILTDLESL